MPQKSMWFLLSGIWCVAVVSNSIDGRGPVVIGFNAFAAALFAALGVLQARSDKLGERGAKLMRWASRAVIALVVVISVVIILTANQ